MSTHEVTVVRIEGVVPCPNADALEVVNIFGYQCVVRKGQFQVGSLAAYLEPDTLVPLDRPEFSFLDKGKGRTFERITVRRFRGEMSYGLLINAPEGSKEGDNIWDLLGVERYEPHHGSTHHLGGGDMSHGYCAPGPEVHAPNYDLENFKRYHELLEPGEPVIYTVKLHGCSSRYVYDGNQMHCGSRTTWKYKPGTHINTVNFTDPVTGKPTSRDIIAPESAWWTCLEQNPWIEDWCKNHPNMVLYGEVYGMHVQGKEFHYGMKEGQYGFAAFDILDNGKWVDNVELFDNPRYNGDGLRTVMVVHRGGHDIKLLEELAEQVESFNNAGHVREGIVIKPIQERTHPKIGRVALKYVSVGYYMMKH